MVLCIIIYVAYLTWLEFVIYHTLDCFFTYRAELHGIRVCGLSHLIEVSYIQYISPDLAFRLNQLASYRLCCLSHIVVFLTLYVYIYTNPFFNNTLSFFCRKCSNTTLLREYLPRQHLNIPTLTVLTSLNFSFASKSKGFVQKCLLFSII